MSKKLTITVTEDVLRWARKKAAEEETSVSNLVRKMLEADMRNSDGYWRAYGRWKKIQSMPGIDAARRLRRDAAHERR